MQLVMFSNDFLMIIETPFGGTTRHPPFGDLHCRLGSVLVWFGQVWSVSACLVSLQVMRTDMGRSVCPGLFGLDFGLAWLLWTCLACSIWPCLFGLVWLVRTCLTCSVWPGLFDLVWPGPFGLLVLA